MCMRYVCDVYVMYVCTHMHWQVLEGDIQDAFVALLLTVAQWNYT